MRLGKACFAAVLDRFRHLIDRQRRGRIPFDFAATLHVGSLQAGIATIDDERHFFTFDRANDGHWLIGSYQRLILRFDLLENALDDDVAAFGVDVEILRQSFSR